MRLCAMRKASDKPRGTTAVMFAVFLPLIVGMMALAVDTAVMTTARDQMSTAADAAALAGVQQLVTNNHLTANPNLSVEISAAQSHATSIGQSNSILGSNAMIAANSGNSSTGDVVVGYLNTASNTSTISPTSSQALFNAVQVKITRDSSHGGVIPAFFSRLNGNTGTRMTVTATATALNYQVGGFTSVNGLSAMLLPIALDQSTYNAMLMGSGFATDQYNYNPSTGTVTPGTDGIFESQLFPLNIGSPGSWGTVDIGVTNNGTSTLGAQVQYGIAPAQLATYPNGTIQLSSSTNPPSIQFSANPGISAGIQSNVDAIIGQTRFIPIYSSVTGDGNNTTYTIVKFAGVRVMASNFQGNPKYIVVQPALVIDPTAIASTPEATWSAGGLISIHLAR
jgi:Flp pilus assembly protein TadG